MDGADDLRNDSRRRLLPIADGQEKCRTVWEAGHYYAAKGPTEWTLIGWSILSRLADPNDGRMLFIDDVHSLDQLHESERVMPSVVFDPWPTPTHWVTESSVGQDAVEILTKLRCRETVPKRSRARKTGKPRRWCYLGMPLASIADEPLCLLYDVGLTARKQVFGFSRAINIVPSFYEFEQRRLTRIIKKILPEFKLEVILFDLSGKWWRM